MPALALTDHGNICSAPNLYHECRKANIEPILGSEMYFVPDSDKTREAKGKADETDSHRFHVVVLAKGAKGYAALSELSTETFRNFYYKPLLDRKILLQADLNHLVFLSGCANSIISKMVLEDPDKAEAELYWWRDNIPNFYLEFQHHNTPFDRKLNKGLYRLAKKYNIPWVITNDPHYTHKNESSYHDILLALQTNSEIDDPERLRFEGNGYHLASHKEMVAKFEPYPARLTEQGIANTVEIAKLCHTRIPDWETRSWHIPKLPGIEDAYKELKTIVFAELRHTGFINNPVYVQRVRDELKIIKQVNIADFLLITRDCVLWAKSQDIPVGPGRGSVCASLVCFLAKIHAIDSIKYDLLFERFLNPERPRMPDIDTDFGQDRRSELFEYVTQKYGEENVLHVCTYGTSKVRRMFQSLAKAHGLTWGEALQISKYLNDDDPIEEQMPDRIKEGYPDLIQQLRALSGIRTSISAHPAGVIITDPDYKIKSKVPQMWIGSSKKWVSQYDLEAIEEMGLMKQDFLGLRTLDTIVECCKLVQKKYGIKLDPNSWVPDEEEGDTEAYALLASGDVSGVFQMEGPTNARGIQEMGCTCFEDIVMCTSLYRSGPILAKFPEEFIKNRQLGKHKIKYLTSELKPILEPTFGVFLFQEQIMRICRELAGMTWIETDDMREAIKHKNAKLMESLAATFLAGCVKTGINKTIAQKIWNQIEGFYMYGYNRPHAVVYSMISYQTLKLKHLYPLEFYCALLRTVDDKFKRIQYLRDIIKAGYQVLWPDINISGAYATPDYRKEPPAIRFGLQDYAGMGPKKVQKILAARKKFKKFKEISQVEELVDKGAFKILLEGNALRSLGTKGKMVVTEKLLGWTFKDRMAPYRDEFESYLVEPGDVQEPVQIVGELISAIKGKTKDGKPFMTWTVRWSPAVEYKCKLWSESDCYWHIPIGTVLRCSGTWQPSWSNVSINGKANAVYVFDKNKWIRADRWSPKNAVKT